MLSSYPRSSAVRVWRARSWWSGTCSPDTRWLGRHIAGALPAGLRRSAFAAALALAAPALLSAQSPTPSAARATSGAAAPDSAMWLRPGDIIRLRIWREPDLSGDFTVDPTGLATLPRLGPTRVTGQAPDALKAHLTAAFAEYLNHPSIEITFLRRVQVLGAVRNPGLYPVDPTMTLGDALALAGGATPDGNPNRLELMHNGVTLARTLSHGTRLAQTRIQSGDEIFVPERSWISRNPGIVATFITASVSLFIALRH